MQEQKSKSDSMLPEDAAQESRRDFLKTAGRFAVYTPPAIMLLMKPSHAQVTGSAVARPCNNGLGNGADCQPPGNPPINDGPGTFPGSPGNRPS